MAERQLTTPHAASHPRLPTKPPDSLSLGPREFRIESPADFGPSSPDLVLLHADLFRPSALTILRTLRPASRYHGCQLCAWAMRVDVAAGTEHALGQLRSKSSAVSPYDVTLLHQPLADLNGLDLASAIHAQIESASLPLVPLSTASADNAPQVNDRVGLVAELIKPVGRSILSVCLAIQRWANRLNPLPRCCNVAIR